MIRLLLSSTIADEGTFLFDTSMQSGSAIIDCVDCQGREMDAPYRGGPPNRANGGHRGGRGGGSGDVRSARENTEYFFFSVPATYVFHNGY